MGKGNSNTGKGGGTQTGRGGSKSAVQKGAAATRRGLDRVTGGGKK